jgi:ribose transport system ATP-binding protein
VTSVTTPLLQVRNLSKAFPGVQALNRVNLDLNRGEVLAVVGENGAGKSTLMKILAGLYPADAGDILLDDKPIHFAGVIDALRAGISLIHQELNLAENLSVSANLFLGRETTWAGALRFLDSRAMDRDAHAYLSRLGLDCDPATRVDHLKVGQRQLVEIARALTLKTRILIMDEPTSSLTQSETDRLFEVIARLRGEGVSLVYISHRLAEVKRVADRVLVLRDGKNAGELAGTEITHDNLVRLMVGRDLKQFFQKHPVSLPPDTKPLLAVRELCYQGGPTTPISFELYPGEITGMAGLVGAGRTELAEALFGIRPVTRGEVLLDGKPLHIRHPGDAIDAGLVLAPEDRRDHGLILHDSIRHNIGLPSLDRLSFLWMVKRGEEAELAREMSEKLSVKTPGIEQTVGLLSGGNQQKVVLSKWLARRPRVLLLDEPTRGIDVGARSEIYALMDRLGREGMAILMISSDLEEVLNMSDRVLVLHQGRLTGTLKREQLDEETVMRLATGGTAAS